MSLTGVAPVWTAGMVAAAFEDAMMTLAALPNSGPSTGLAQSRHEVVREAVEAYGWGTATYRPPVPPARKITEMETILRWLALIPETKFVLRRVIALRAVTHYATGKAMSWRRIGAKLQANPAAIPAWHAQGISMIVRALNAQGVTSWRQDAAPAHASAMGRSSASAGICQCLAS